MNKLSHPLSVHHSSLSNHHSSLEFLRVLSVFRKPTQTINQLLPLHPPVTILVLLSTAARAWIVSPDARSVMPDRIDLRVHVDARLTVLARRRRFGLVRRARVDRLVNRPAFGERAADELF